MVIDLISAVLLVIGAGFGLIAAIGVVRMPDLFTRMHASTKAGALGAGMILLGVGIHSRDAALATRAFAAVVFVVLTAPVAAHVIGRAGYIIGARLWEGTIVDELKGHYDMRTHTLRSDVPPSEPPQEHR